MLQSGLNTLSCGNVILPCGEDARENSFNAEVFKRFISHLSHVPISRAEIKVLSSIQFTADMLDLSDAHVSKILVELGLRAPRIAFPMEFLEYSDAAVMRQGWNVGAPSKAMMELRQYWLRYHREVEMNTAFPAARSLLEEKSMV